MNSNEEDQRNNGPGDFPFSAPSDASMHTAAPPGANLTDSAARFEAQESMQQALYTEAEEEASCALESGSADAATAAADHAATSADAQAATAGAYAWPPAQQPPFPGGWSEGYEAPALQESATYAATPLVAGPAGRPGPYALPYEGTGDVDQPLSVGGHPYAARPGSMHSRRVGVFLSPVPDGTDQGASVGLEPTGMAASKSDQGEPARHQFVPAWKDKDRICAYCKTENWARRTFCYQCRTDFATGWWHREGCTCGEC